MLYWAKNLRKIGTANKSMSFIRMMVKGAKEESKSGFTVIKWGGEGDFIVISRTFFFYPNLVWILNFLFFKEKFPTTALFLHTSSFLCWRIQHVTARSVWSWSLDQPYIVTNCRHYYWTFVTDSVLSKIRSFFSCSTLYFSSLFFRTRYFESLVWSF